MATKDYAPVVAKVKQLILNTGRSVVFKKFAASNLSEPWKTTPNVYSTSITVPATFVPAHTYLHGFGENVIDENLLKRVERVALCGQASENISKFDIVEDLGELWVIDWVDVLKPANEIVLYAFGLKK